MQYFVRSIPFGLSQENEEIEDAKAKLSRKWDEELVHSSSNWSTKVE